MNRNGAPIVFKGVKTSKTALGGQKTSKNSKIYIPLKSENLLLCKYWILGPSACRGSIRLVKLVSTLLARASKLSPKAMILQTCAKSLWNYWKSWNLMFFEHFCNIMALGESWEARASSVDINLTRRIDPRHAEGPKIPWLQRNMFSIRIDWSTPKLCGCMKTNDF